MSFDIRCNRCRRVYIFADSKRGQRIWCKVCGSALTTAAEKAARETGASPQRESSPPVTIPFPLPLSVPRRRAFQIPDPNQKLVKTLAMVGGALVLLCVGIGLAMALWSGQSTSTPDAVMIPTLPAIPEIPQVKPVDPIHIQVDGPSHSFQFTGLPPSVTRHLAAPILQPPPATPIGPWIDLLANLDLEKQKLAGQWTIDQGTLTCKSTQEFAKFSLRPPPSSCYELEMTFNRRLGQKEFCINLPAGRPGQISLGGMTGQSSEIAGVTQTEGFAGSLLINDKDQVLDIMVRAYGDQVAVNVYLDGQAYMTWAGPQSRMSYHPIAMGDPNVIGLAIHSDDTVDFKEIKVRPLTQQSP